MAYSNGNPVIVANATPNTVKVGATTIPSQHVAKVIPTDAVKVKLSAEAKGVTTALTVSALPQAVQAGSVIDFEVSGTNVQFVVEATAASGATSIAVVSTTPAVAIPSGTEGLTSSQGEVTGFVEQGCTVVSIGLAYPDVLDSKVMAAEKGARLLESMSRATIAAGSGGTFSAWGL